MKFQEEIHPQMKTLLEKLKKSTAYCEETLQNLHIHSGAYVFYEDDKPMHVGIVGRHSKGDIRKRIQQHCSGSPSAAPLASRMTIEDLRLGSMTLKQLNRDYTPEFREKQKLVRNMEVRAVAIKCCATLAVFEIYAAMTLETPHNDFCTH